MTPFPLNLVELFGNQEQFVIFLLIGFGFGYALEIGGFGNSRQLAAQFYFKDLTVLRSCSPGSSWQWSEFSWLLPWDCWTTT